MNLCGGKQVCGMNYFNTYALAVTCFAIRITIFIVILFTMALQQVDFIQAYPQALIKTDMYMELLKGIETCKSSKAHVPMLLANLYAQN